ncbi:hypothetical protein L7F22_008696 [Adiantum nelumboides]|nr:hypothetical protein [Adiantum nelumboides]
MGKDSKAKETSKGKGKQASNSGGSDEGASKGKGKGGKSAVDGLGTCTYVKARHILCEKQGKINEAYKKLQDGWLDNGDKVPPAEFAKVYALGDTQFHDLLHIRDRAGQIRAQRMVVTGRPDQCLPQSQSGGGRRARSRHPTTSQPASAHRPGKAPAFAMDVDFPPLAPHPPPQSRHSSDHLPTPPTHVDPLSSEVAAEFSECPSGKKGGDLGWFPRGKMAGPFQEVAFATPVGVCSAPFKSTHGYHIILAEGRKN